MNRQQIGQTKRWVVKIGSALLRADGKGLDRAAIADWARQIASLRSHGHEVLVVSSGAVAEASNASASPRDPRRCTSFRPRRP